MHRRLTRAVVSGGVVLALAGTVGTLPEPMASAQPSGSRTLDRTFLCAPSLAGGVWQVVPSAHKGTGRHGSSWDRPAITSIWTNISGAAETAIDNELVWLTAGMPSADAEVVSTRVGFTFPVRSWGTIGANARRCRASTARVPLGRGGLEGGATGPFDERYACETSKRILVRVRAVPRSGASLSGYRGFLHTTVPVREGSLAVRTQSGRPLVYAELFESGKALFYKAALPRCRPD
jgi:hypothetical protein